MYALVRDDKGNVVFDDFDAIPPAVFLQLERADKEYCLKKMSAAARNDMLLSMSSDMALKVSTSAQIISRFTPLEDFDCPDMRTSYKAGLKYMLREGNVKLAEKLKVWIAEKKVRVV